MIINLNHKGWSLFPSNEEDHIWLDGKEFAFGTKNIGREVSFSLGRVSLSKGRFNY